MGYIMDSISLWFASGVGAVVRALLILILALAAASLAKKLAAKAWNKLPLKERITPAETANSMGELLCSAVYLLVFLLFAPGILSALGLESMSQPITGILTAFWGYLPNIAAAGIILVVGLMAARLVRQLLAQLLSKLKLDALQHKTGVELPETGKLAETAAYIVYVLILIPAAIAALQALDIEAVSRPAVEMLSRIVAFIPNVAVGLILAVIGCVTGKLGGQIVEKLTAASGLDEKLAALLDADEKMSAFRLSKAAGVTVNVVVDIFFAVEALNVLQLEVLKQIGAAVIGYMPSVLAAVLIAMGCMLAASAAAKLLKGQKKVYTSLARTAIFVLGAFMVLSQLGVAGTLVNAAFILLVGALAVAFAVAFGLGGREFAARTLERLEQSAQNSKNQKEN